MVRGNFFFLFCCMDLMLKEREDSMAEFEITSIERSALEENL